MQKSTSPGLSGQFLNSNNPLSYALVEWVPTNEEWTIKNERQIKDEEQIWGYKKKGFLWQSDQKIGENDSTFITIDLNYQQKQPRISLDQNSDDPRY